MKKLIFFLMFCSVSAQAGSWVVDPISKECNYQEKTPKQQAKEMKGCKVLRRTAPEGSDVLSCRIEKGVEMTWFYSDTIEQCKSILAHIIAYQKNKQTE